MSSKVTIYCKNNRSYYDVERGVSLLEIYKMIGIELPYKVVAARVNYKVEDLNFYLYKPKDIEFLDASCPSGMRVYIRTLSMVLAAAINEVQPNAELRIEHPISRGYYCHINNSEEPLTPELISRIKERMQLIISEDREIISEEKQTKIVKDLFKDRTGGDTSLFDAWGTRYCRYFRLVNPNGEDYIDYYAGVLMPSAGYAEVFDLVPYHDGMLLMGPSRSNPTQHEEILKQDKMFEILNENKDWNRLMHINNVGEFNLMCKDNRAFNLIKLSEALHEKKMIQIADMISNRPGGRPKFILVSGPSSSGKTTFSKRLSIQLMVNGISPVIISMDNYFVNRVDTPKDENGDWDFEHIDALDLNLFHQHLNELIEGEEVKLPTYSFEEGKRLYLGNTLKLKDDSVVIIEGIHALNPKTSEGLPPEALFKIYVSPLTSINLDNHNWIATTDSRLLRRIIRDYRYRNYSAQETIARMASVRRGEEKWIFPYQENADVMFNSALVFELAVLKRHAEPILSEVPKFSDEYTEAHRLLKLLKYFIPVPEKEIPPTSLLREFVGGSSFRYKN